MTNLIRFVSMVIISLGVSGIIIGIMITNDLEQENEMFKERIETLEQRKEELDEAYSKGDNFKQISYEELVEFMEKDTTRYNEYVDPDYVCGDFSSELIGNAREESIFMCPTHIWIKTDYGTFETTGGHSFVKALTSEGDYFIEPQTAAIFENLRVGDNYCDKVNWYCEWEVTKIVEYC